VKLLRTLPLFPLLLASCATLTSEEKERDRLLVDRCAQFLNDPRNKTQFVFDRPYYLCREQGVLPEDMELALPAAHAPGTIGLSEPQVGMHTETMKALFGAPESITGIRDNQFRAQWSMHGGWVYTIDFVSDRVVHIDKIWINPN
jgi:hypothetical protein